MGVGLTPKITIMIIILKSWRRSKTLSPLESLRVIP